MSEPLALTVDEVAARTRIGRNAVYRAIKEGRLRVVRIGTRIVVPMSAVTEWLEQESGRGE